MCLAANLSGKAISISKTTAPAPSPIKIQESFPDGLTFKNSMTISENIRLTLSQDILNALAAGKGPEKSLIALGYAGWEPGQLETEMLANTWLNIPANPEIIFDVPFSDRWVYATNSLGIDISRLSPHAGHA